jgi:Inner membrane protein YgaP-like, transmembrane domain
MSSLRCAHNDMGAPADTAMRRWPLERVLFALAGTMTLASALLAALVSPWFLVLTAFVGVNQWAYALVGACPASLVLRRAFGLRSTVYPDDETPAAAAALADAVARTDAAALLTPRRDPSAAA